MAKTKDDYKLGCLLRDKIISKFIDDLEKLAETFDENNEKNKNNYEVYKAIKNMDDKVRQTIANISISQFIDSYLEESMTRLPSWLAEHCKYKHLKEIKNAK